MMGPVRAALIGFLSVAGVAGCMAVAAWGTGEGALASAWVGAGTVTIGTTCWATGALESGRLRAVAFTLAILCALVGAWDAHASGPPGWASRAAVTAGFAASALLAAVVLREPMRRTPRDSGVMGGACGVVAAWLILPWLVSRVGTHPLLLWSPLALWLASALVEREGASGVSQSADERTKVPAAPALIAWLGLASATLLVLSLVFMGDLMLRAREWSFAVALGRIVALASLVILVGWGTGLRRQVAKLGAGGGLLAPPLLLLSSHGVGAAVDGPLDHARFFLALVLMGTLVPWGARPLLDLLPRAPADELARRAIGWAIGVSLVLAGLLVLVLSTLDADASPDAVRAALAWCAVLLLLAWAASALILRMRYQGLLLDGLSSPDPAARLAALSALEGLTPEGFASVLRRALASPSEATAVLAAQLTRETGHPELEPDLLQATTHGAAVVRVEALLALEMLAPEKAAETALRLLEDEHASVRGEAWTVLGRLVQRPQSDSLRQRVGEEGMRRLEAERDPSARASLLRAASEVGLPGEALRASLEEMAGQPDEAWRVAAALALPLPLDDEGATLAAKLLDDPSLEVRRSVALRLRGPVPPDLADRLRALLADEALAPLAASALASSGDAGLSQLEEALAAADAPTRCRIHGVLATIGSPFSLACLEEGLSDPAPTVRLAAAEGFVKWAAVLEPSDVQAAARAATEAVQALEAQARALSGHEDSPARRFLRETFEEAARSGGATLAALRRAGVGSLDIETGAPEPLDLATLASGDDPWVARCARSALAGAGEGGDAMLTLFEKMLFLRGVELFRDLPPRDLASVAEGVREAAFVRGEVLCEEGDPGEALFLVTSGSVAVTKGPDRVRVGTLGAGQCVGEMALLTGEPRSARVEAAEDTRVLVFRREDFQQLIQRHPSVSFPLFRILAGRLKETTTRYQEALARERPAVSGSGA